MSRPFEEQAVDELRELATLARSDAAAILRRVNEGRSTNTRNDLELVEEAQERADRYERRAEVAEERLTKARAG